MKALYLVIGLIWLALLPPLFTKGTCTSEFDYAYSQVVGNQAALKTPEVTREFLRSKQWQVSLLTQDECHRAKPRWVEGCGRGTLVVAKRAIENPICRYYRDDAVRAQLQFDDRNRLDRMIVEMQPFKSLPLPFGLTLDWAR